jgi:ribosomal protein S18 acetylase RimI-like enzyme
MNNQVIISLATVDDAQDIARLNLLFNEATDPAEAIAARMIDPHCVETAILAKVAGKAVGFALVRVVPRVLYATHHAELTELYVLNDYRRQGIAKALVVFAEGIAKQQGAKSLLVLTGDDNLPALSFYRQNDFADDDVSLRKKL